MLLLVENNSSFTYIYREPHKTLFIIVSDVCKAIAKIFGYGLMVFDCVRARNYCSSRLIRYLINSLTIKAA